MRNIPIGSAVETTTTSGEWIGCIVVGYEDGELLLYSPEHGYVILRARWEVKPCS